MKSRPHIFGVRHLSPGAAWHLNRLLDSVKPTAILVEGLSDANDLIPHILNPKTKLPVAILAYTDSLPVRTLVYPLAEYSPEYQAILWGNEHDAEVRFIDLPSSTFLALQGKEEVNPEEEDEKEKVKEYSEEQFSVQKDIYQEFADQSGESDYETYWERNFELNLVPGSYQQMAWELGVGLRELDAAPQLSVAENLVREAYMRRCIQEAINDGHDPGRIVVVVGAYHASAMDVEENECMSDKEVDSLPVSSNKLTLMPYSFLKLSSQSGYGAGNHAPAFFGMMWDSMQRDDLDSLAAEYLARIVRHIRSGGTSRSTAEVIEGVRLARSLAGLKGGNYPTLRDLQDSAITLIGHGERSTVAEAMARVEVGTNVGALPEGVSQTSIQDDFNTRLKVLKLTKYRTTVMQDLSLDLRENRRVSSEAAAFLDLNRSFFLHRLRILEIPFCGDFSSRNNSGTWAEDWKLQWTPEAEIALVEAVLLGETVELATAYKFKIGLDDCKSINEASSIVLQACMCGMADAMESARIKLQELAGESSEFNAIANAANELGMVVRYGDIRKFDTTPLLPLIEQLFVEAALNLCEASNCDASAASDILESVAVINKLSLDYDQLVDEELWIAELRKLSDADYLNPTLSGFACAILIERGLINNEEISREVSRRLSPGIEADLGAGWFEGLAMRNRYALLGRLFLWEQLVGYIASLDDEQFQRSLVFLRRAFGKFSASEKQQIAENLGEVWNLNPDDISEILMEDVSEELEELNDFDFDEF